MHCLWENVLVCVQSSSKLTQVTQYLWFTMQLFRFLGHTFLSIFYPNCALVALSVTAYGSRVTSRNPSVPRYTLGIRRVVQNTLTYRVIYT